MILMIQKNRVTSGTLFRIRRAGDVVIVVMPPKIGTTAWKLPERLRGVPCPAAVAQPGHGGGRGRRPRRRRRRVRAGERAAGRGPRRRECSLLGRRPPRSGPAR